MIAVALAAALVATAAFTSTRGFPRRANGRNGWRTATCCGRCGIVSDTGGEGSIPRQQRFSRSNGEGNGWSPLLAAGTGASEHEPAAKAAFPRITLQQQTFSRSGGRETDASQSLAAETEASAGLPAASAATPGSRVFSAAAARKTTLAQSLAAVGVSSVAAPSARATLSGSRGFPRAVVAENA